MPIDPGDDPTGLRERLLDTVRGCLATVSPGLDTAAVQAETALGALFFDSFMVVKFMATLEPALGARDLPFEEWIREHSERTDRLTVGALIDWLAERPELGRWARGISG